MPVGGFLTFEAEAVGDLLPFGVGFQQGVLRRFLAADGRGNGIVQCRQIFRPAGQPQRAEPLLVTQCGLGRVGILHRGSGGNRLFDPLAGRFQVRLRGTASSGGLAALICGLIRLSESHSSSWNAASRLGRVLADHAQPAGDRQQRDVRAFVVGPLLPDVAVKVENAPRAGEFDEADAERGERRGERGEGRPFR